MNKIIFSILFFSIFLSLFFAKEAYAIQEAYITLIEYSIDDPTFGPYNPITNQGVIAWVEDEDGLTRGGKVYKVAPGAPMMDYNNPFFDPTMFRYEEDKIAIIDTTTHSEGYTRYTVKNTGTDPIENLRATSGGDGWGTEMSYTNWWSTGGYYISRLGYLNPGETEYEIYVSKIENFPKGYLWKPIILRWPDGNVMPSEYYGYKPIFYTQGPDFYPPEIDCPYPSDREIEYGGTYTHTYSYHNPSSNTVYLELHSSSGTLLYGTWGARYQPAIFSHYFDEEIITLNSGQTLYGDKTVTINEIYSPDRRNVNLSHLYFGYCYRICLDSSCTQGSPLESCFWPPIGHGSGKYLGIKDPGTFSKTVIGANNKPAYQTFFNLYNSDTQYNETVQAKDYYIDIQILEEGDDWYQDASTAVRHYEFFVENLEQETGATPIFPGFFDADTDTAYPFFYEIPDIDQIPLDQIYKLYITTIWRNHPRTNLDEPIDQIVRSFAPGLDIELEDVYLPATEKTLTTSNNYIWNFSSFPLDIEINLSESVDNFSIITSLPISFTLTPGEKRFFQIDFEYFGNKPSTDLTSSLIGEGVILITGNSISSDTDQASIFIEKSDKPTITSVLLNSWIYCNLQPEVGLVGFGWAYDETNYENQSQYHLQVATADDFALPSLIVDTIRNQEVSPSENGGSGVKVLLNPTADLSDLDVGYNKSYYWRVQIKDKNENWSDWVEYNDLDDPDDDGKAKTFTTPDHPYPWPDFAWLPKNPAAKEIIQFTDLSIFYDSSKSWFWSFGDGESSTDQNPAHSYSFPENLNVTLTVTDGDDYNCSLSKPLNISLPLPSWKEIISF